MNATPKTRGNTRARGGGGVIDPCSLNNHTRWKCHIKSNNSYLNPRQILVQKFFILMSRVVIFQVWEHTIMFPTRREKQCSSLHHLQVCPLTWYNKIHKNWGWVKQNHTQCHYKRFATFNINYTCSILKTIIMLFGFQQPLKYFL